MDLKTPLYDSHLSLGGKIVPFAGYLMPVQYGTGVIKEHVAVRTAAGLFDVSHMGEVIYRGKDALSNVQKIVTNDCSGMADGQIRYSPMCNNEGGVVDDLIVYRMNENKYLLVINAANRHKDVAWMKQHLFGDCTFEDISDETALIALQGPRAFDIFAKLSDSSNIPKRYYFFTPDVKVGGVNCIVSRTGYTGELGIEFFCASSDAETLWNALLEAGREEGLIPCGLGARDTLRLEAAMPLYGHELTDDITPLEAGLPMFVKLGKEDFIGKSAMIEKGEPKVKRVGLKITGRGIAREHCLVYSGGKQIGETTSGTFCPSLDYPAAMAMIEKDFAELGNTVEVDVRGKKVEAVIVPLPFYKRA